jgi:ribulose-phosphate 3-epimerase
MNADFETHTRHLLQKLGLPTLNVNSRLLRQALTHKSMQLDRPHSAVAHNERLEYLGDAILKSSISEWLFLNLPQDSEGRMSQIRSYVVSDVALSRAAQRIALQDHIILGSSERASGEVRESILANVFEAVCGAIFLSSDYRTTARMILPLLMPELELAIEGEAEEVLNYKARLQEYAQGEYKALPEYQMMAAEGPDHDRVFRIQVSLNEEILGTGEGRSKKKAEQESARQALIALKLIEDRPRSTAPAIEVVNAPYIPETNTPQHNTVLLAPSILSADFADLGKALHHITQGGADWVHLDIMDGHFVPNLTFGAPVISALRPLSELHFDAHLMIEKPERLIPDFLKAGCNGITVHYETCPHLDRTLSQIAEGGARPGVSLNPSTPVHVLEDILHKTGLVLLMSVNPGFGGQKFIPRVLDKIRALKAMITAQGLHDIRIQVDGGINAETLGAVIEAGADVLVIGSAIFGHTDVTAQTRHYQQLIHQAQTT